MAKWFYHNGNGEKIEVTGGQLKGLAKAGMITPDTIVETEEGKTAPARKVKGLTFGETIQPSAESAQPAISPNAVPSVTTLAVSENWYYYDDRGKALGPIPLNVLQSFARDGIITPETVVANEKGLSAPARKVKELMFVETAQPFDKPNSPASANPFDVFKAAMNKISVPSTPNEPATNVIEAIVRESPKERISQLKHQREKRLAKQKRLEGTSKSLEVHEEEDVPWNFFISQCMGAVIMWAGFVSIGLIHIILGIPILVAGFSFWVYATGQKEAFRNRCPSCKQGSARQLTKTTELGSETIKYTVDEVVGTIRDSKGAVISTTTRPAERTYRLATQENEYRCQYCGYEWKGPTYKEFVGFC